MLDLTPPLLVSLATVLLLGFTFHEFAHAWVADYFGDDTPRSQGRLTLNPLAHLDIVGTLLLLFAGFGWAKPVQVNIYELERSSPAAPMLVAVAGPFANFILAVIAAIPLASGLVPPTPNGAFLPSLYFLLVNFVFYNLVLMLFNLLPFFPLDGEKIAVYFLPGEIKNFWLRMRRLGPMVLMLVIFFGPNLGLNITGWFVFGPANWIVSLIV